MPPRSSNAGNLQVTLGVNSENLAKGFMRASKEVERLQKDLNKFKSTLDKSAGSLGKVDRNLDKAAAATRGLGKEMRKTGRTSSSFFGKFGKSALNVTGLNNALELVKKIAIAYEQVAKHAEKAAEMQNLALGVGVNVEDFQAMSLVFQQFNLEADDANDVLNEINVKLGDAAAGVKSAKDAFETLNIPIRDAEGNLRRNLDVWLDLIDAVQKGGTDAATVNAVDAIAGGDIARKTLPLLQLTKAEYRNLVAEATQLVTPSDKIAELAKQHAERIKQAAERQQAWNELALKLAPLMEVVNKVLVATIGYLANILGMGNQRVALETTFEGLKAQAKALNIDIDDVVASLDTMTEHQRNRQPARWMKLMSNAADELRERIAAVADTTDRVVRGTPGGGGGERQLTELEKLIAKWNEINETISDPDKFAAYAEIERWTDRVAAAQERLNQKLEDYERRQQQAFDFATGGTPVGLNLTPITGRAHTGTTEQEDAAKRAAELQAEINEKARLATEAAREAAEKYAQAWQNVGQFAANALSRIVLHAQSATDRLRALADVLLQVLAAGLGGVAGGLSFGQGVAQFFGFAGGRAMGGPVSPGVAYRVQEVGPEYFVPNTPGRIVPAGDMQQASTTVQFIGHTLTEADVEEIMVRRLGGLVNLDG